MVECIVFFLERIFLALLFSLLRMTHHFDCMCSLSCSAPLHSDGNSDRTLEYLLLYALQIIYLFQEFRMSQHCCVFMVGGVRVYWLVPVLISGLAR